MKLLKLLLNLVRFGKVTAVTKCTIEGIPAEIAYYDRRGRLIGWWAYGYFDPSMPYNA